VSAAEGTGLSLDTWRYYEREWLMGPVRRLSNGQRRYSEDDLAWIGIVSYLRDAGLGIADLRHFTELLRSEHAANDRVPFLQRRRDELLERLRQTEAASLVLDDKVAHYGQPIA
jgi:DNA-binding transcriptional MerR regulator